MPAWWNTLTDDELAVLEAEYEEQRACESVEAEEAHWRGVFAAMPPYLRNVRYSTRPWLNRPRSDG